MFCLHSKLASPVSDIISRNLNGAEQIANRKCLMIEFYKILKDMEPRKEDLAAEILRNLTGKPKGNWFRLDFDVPYGFSNTFST